MLSPCAPMPMRVPMINNGHLNPKTASTLRTRILLAILLASTLPTLMIIAWRSFYSLGPDLEQQTQAAMEAHAALLTNALQLPVWNLDRQTVNALITAAHKDPAIAGVVVTDEFGNLISPDRPRDKDLGGNILTNNYPLYFNRQKIGSVSLLVSRQPFHDAALHEIQASLVILMLQAVISILVAYYLLNRQVIIPITRLASAANRISDGNFATPITTRRQDEVGMLYADMEKMRISLNTLFNHLDDEVRARTVELVNANQCLNQLVDELNRTRHELVIREKIAALGSLVAGISHELNTPLGNCLLAVSLLRDNLAQLKEDFTRGMSRSTFENNLRLQDEAINISEKSLRRAIDLLTRFRSISPESHKTALLQFSVNDLLHNLTLTMAGNCRQGISLAIEAEPHLMLSSFQSCVWETLYSLVDNATRHAFPASYEAGLITLCAQGTEEGIAITVKDNGQGMSETDAKKIFDPFFTTQMGKGSSGLGMYIIYNMVSTVLGGHISVTSAPGKGTCIQLLLPNLYRHDLFPGPIEAALGTGDSRVTQS